MSDHLTPEQLDQIRGRAEAATDGPWTETYNPSDEWTTITGQSHLLDGEIWKLCPEVATCEGEPWDDSNFIANARQDVPALLAHADAQAATIQRVLKLHEPVMFYDECECPDETHPDGYEFTDVGEYIGCENSFIGYGCRHCCIDGDYAREVCVHGETAHHAFTHDRACPTRAKIKEEQ